MEPKRYLLRKRAQAGLDLIFASIYEDNPKAAKRLYEAFLEKFEFLALFPETGRLREEFTFPVRSLSVGNYLIFFTYQEPVEIVRILHGARELIDDLDNLE